MLDEPALVVAADRIGPHKALGQANRAELEALGELHFFAGAERDFDASAPDVDDNGALWGIDAVDGRHVDESRFFGARDDPRADPGCALDCLEKLPAVFRLARGARGRREDLVHFVRFGEAFELYKAWSAELMASCVSFLPSRPPAPSRTISFSRSITSKEKSGRREQRSCERNWFGCSMAARRIWCDRYNLSC